MWRKAAVLSSLLVAGAGSALAQVVPGERQPNPQAVSPWDPTTPQPTQTPARRPTDRSATTTDPWQPFQRTTPGFTSGQFTFLPAVTVGAYYDDNVFATNANRQGDWVGFVRPELGIATAGSNYAVQAHGFLESRWHDRFSADDQVNGGAELGSTVMVDPNTQLIGKLRYLRGHEERGGGESSLFPGYDEPLGFDTFEASAAINKRFNRWWTSVGVAGLWTEYDTPTVLGVPFPQNYRDGDVGVLTGRVGYVVAPLTSVFIEWAGNRRDFEVDPFDSEGYRVVGGLLFEPGQGARLRGEVFAGYMHQDYVGATFNTISTFTYGGALAYILAPGWTAVVEGRRQALESALNGGVSLIESLVAGRLDYAIKPNLIVGVGASYLHDDFQGAGRTDEALSPLVSVKYLVNPFVTLGFDYRTTAFDTNAVAAADYRRNIYLLSLNARL